MSQPVACDFTHNRKQVVNRLKIPQGLSTLLFHRGVKFCFLELLARLFSIRTLLLTGFCFLELLARLFSIRTLLLTGFVVLCSHL